MIKKITLLITPIFFLTSFLSKYDEAFLNMSCGSLTRLDWSGLLRTERFVVAN